MKKTTIGLSAFLAPGVALFASRHVRFFAAVLVTALVGVTLSACSGNDLGGEACVSYRLEYSKAPSGSDEKDRYYAAWEACAEFRAGEERLKQISESGACVSYHRKARKAPSGSDEGDRYYALWEACVLGGENLAEEILESGACLSYHRKYREAPLDSDEEEEQLDLWKDCLRKHPAWEQKTTGGVQTFETIVNDMVATLKEEIGENTRPTLVIVPIESRVGENIDTEKINESIRIRLNKLRFFRVVSRNLETILKKVQLAQSGLADADTAVEVGRLIGAQYVLYGTVANMSDNQQTNYRVVLTLIEIEITGFEVFVDAAQVRK